MKKRSKVGSYKPKKNNIEKLKLFLKKEENESDRLGTSSPK